MKMMKCETKRKMMTIKGDDERDPLLIYVPITNCCFDLSI